MKAGVEKRNTVIIEAARYKEWTGLLKNGTFKPTKMKDVEEGKWIFGSRFVDELKRAEKEGRLIRKSRLVAQKYSDINVSERATKALTIQRFFQILLISLAASMDNMTIFSRDVTEAYVHSESKLERPVFIKPPKYMVLPGDFVLQVVKPLYGIPESGLEWYLIYLNNHQERLRMKRSTADPCFLILHNEKGI